MSTEQSQSSEHSLPDTFDELTRTCIDCGDVVDRTFLEEDGRCVGCHLQRSDRDDE